MKTRRQLRFALIVGTTALLGCALAAHAAGRQSAPQSSVGELTGKVALVTGATRNLGRGYAIGLARAGADIVVHYHLPADRPDAEETARLVRAEGTRTATVSGDLCDVRAIARIFDETVRAFGRVDIVVNNAGQMVKKPITDVTEEDFDRVFCVNARGTFFMMREAARRISDNGRIINIGSSLIASTIGEYAVYAGSKAAMEQFTRALAREIGARGVTVNMVAPGPVDTPFYFAAESTDSVARATRTTVAGRLGRIDDVVPLVAFLASPRSQWITAQTIFINGGSVAR
jgi:NAD(P)-dependent dehydrogenase (short-subunit alcohol dehydrogenase family)